MQITTFYSLEMKSFRVDTYAVQRERTRQQQIIARIFALHSIERWTNGRATRVNAWTCTLNDCWQAYFIAVTMLFYVFHTDKCHRRAYKRTQQLCCCYCCLLFLLLFLSFASNVYEFTFVDATFWLNFRFVLIQRHFSRRKAISLYLRQSPCIRSATSVHNTVHRSIGNDRISHKSTHTHTLMAYIFETNCCTIRLM